MSGKTRKITYCAALIAAAVVLAYLSRLLNPFVSLPFLRFSLAPAVVMFAGAVLGWGYGAAAGALADALTFALFPTGAYFPGYTLTMALYGALAGLFYQNRVYTVKKAAGTTILIQTLLSAGLNTFWFTLTMGPLDPVKLGMRLVTSYAACAAFILILSVLFKTERMLARRAAV